jgi:hypothetical protein
MSISPVTIIIFVAVALALKVSALIAIAVAALRRFDRWPVYGVWYLVGDDGQSVAIPPAERPSLPLVQGFGELLTRNFARMEITRSGDTITVRTADGIPFNYGGAKSKVLRSMNGGLQVGASWERLGDIMKLESEVTGSGTIVETYRPAGKNLEAEVRITVPGSGIDEMVVRQFRRTVVQHQILMEGSDGPGSVDVP